MTTSKQKTEMISIRLNPYAVKELEEMASLRYLPLRTLIRIWVMERLEKEKEGVTNGQKV